jgi:hypothetical protein
MKVSVVSNQRTQVETFVCNIYVSMTCQKERDH